MAATSASATASLSVAARIRHRKLSSSARVPAQTTHPILKLNRRSYAVSASAASLSPQSIWEGQGIRAESEAPGAPASGDVMGLLLRERIIFLGNEIEDFLADAVVSQLLLLDAMDPESDIRLFINSPGGSLRSPSNCINPFHSFIHLLLFSRVGLDWVYPVSKDCLWWTCIVPNGHLVGKLLCANSNSVHDSIQSRLFDLI